MSSAVASLSRLTPYIRATRGAERGPPATVLVVMDMLAVLAALALVMILALVMATVPAAKRKRACWRWRWCRS